MEINGCYNMLFIFSLDVITSWNNMTYEMLLFGMVTCSHTHQPKRFK